MLKKVLLMAAVALLGLPGLAHAQLGRGEISVGYGVAPVTDWIDAYSDKLLDVLDMKDASMDSWGGVSVNYTFRIVGGLGVGATFVYSGNNQRLAGKKISTDYYSIMPHLKMRWLNLRILSLYSRVGVGLTFTESSGEGITSTLLMLLFMSVFSAIKPSLKWKLNLFRAFAGHIGHAQDARGLLLHLHRIRNAVTRNEQDLLPACDERHIPLFARHLLVDEEFLELAPARRVQRKEAVSRKARAHAKPLRGQLIRIEAGGERLPNKAAHRRFLRKKRASGRACFPAVCKRQLKRLRLLPRADVKKRVVHPCVRAGQMQPRARARAEERAYLLHMDARNVLRGACLRKCHAHRAALQGGRQRKERRPVIGMLAPPRFGKRGRSLLAKVRFVLREQLRRGRERRYNRRVHIFGKVRQYIQPEPVARALPKKVRFIRAEGKPLL